MSKIITYSILLLLGMLESQLFDLRPFMPYIETATVVCLAYIMIEVGLEFTIDKNNLSSYGKDYLIAMTAAAFPWIFCAIYFYYVLNVSWQDSLLIGRFAAPTSAGILFAMLSAAGLGVTWLFNKARILAIFDDLDTIILMIPLQMLYVGFAFEAKIVLAAIILILVAAYVFLHKLKVPISQPWMLFYAFLIVGLCEYVEHTTDVHLEVLLPAFAIGCIIYNPHDPYHPLKHYEEYAYGQPMVSKKFKVLDASIKYVFMFLVGCSIPKIYVEANGLDNLIFHVVILTILSNVGKMFPTLCYKDEASFRERLALSISMFPRGEVGAGVLLVALGYGLKGKATSIAALSLGLNLVLTGPFILLVIWLLSSKDKHHIPKYYESK